MAAAALAAACTDNRYPGNDRGAASAEPAPPAELTPAQTALAEANPEAVFPAAMTAREMSAVLDPNDACSFAFTSAGEPALAAQPDGPGVIKTNGKLVALQAADDGAPGAVLHLAAGGLEVSVWREDGATAAGTDGKRVEATLLFIPAGGPERGFRGYYRCPGAA